MNERAVKLLETAGYKPRIVGEAHEVDPRKELMDKFGPIAEHATVLSGKVLVAIYQRPEKTAGGILRPDKNREEDRWQGKIGLVLKIGPVAFTEDETHKWGGVTPKVGDWVQFRVGDTFGFSTQPNVNLPDMRYIDENLIMAIWDRPDLVW